MRLRFKWQVLSLKPVALSDTFLLIRVGDSNPGDVPDARIPIKMDALGCFQDVSSCKRIFRESGCAVRIGGAYSFHDIIQEQYSSPL
jgi:hypothetical protein